MTLATTFALAVVLGQQPDLKVYPPTDQAQLRLWYSLGEKGNELEFCLDRAKIDHYVAAKQDNYVAGEGEKLITLAFRVKNPHKRDVGLGASTFSFLATADGETYEFRGYLLNGANLNRRTGSLLAGETVSCVVVIPAKFRSDLVQVRVKKGESDPVRYDLTGKMAPLVSTYAYGQGKHIGTDPNVPVTPGQMFDIAPWRVTYIGHEYTSEKIRGYPPAPKMEFFVVRFRFTNMMELPVGIGFQHLTARLAGWNGKEVSWNRLLLAQGTEDMLAQEILKGGYADGYYYFEVPTDAPELGFSLTDNNSKRRITFTVPPRG